MPHGQHRCETRRKRVKRFLAGGHPSCLGEHWSVTHQAGLTERCPLPGPSEAFHRHEPDPTERATARERTPRVCANIETGLQCCALAAMIRSHARNVRCLAIP